MSYFGLQYIFNYSNVDPVRKNDGKRLQCSFGENTIQFALYIVIFYDENYIINKDEIEVSLDDNLADSICDLLDKTTDNLSKIGQEFQNAITFTLNNIKVLARISENKNINMYYLDGSYKACINHADDDKSGEIVKVTIDKKWVFQT